MKTTWYRVNHIMHNYISIKEFVVTGNTPHTVTFIDEYECERKESKNSKGHAWFICEDAAKKYAARVAEQEIARYQKFIDGILHSVEKYNIPIETKEEKID